MPRYTTAEPSGTIKKMGTVTPPPGWLICDTSPVSRTQYANLFAKIGTAYGSGDGSTTFNLPEGRGVFFRGVDFGSGNDPDAASRTAMSGGNSGDNPGSYQPDQNVSHGHAYLANNSTINVGSVGAFTTNSSTYYNGNITGSGGNQANPRNVYAVHMIKF